MELLLRIKSLDVMAQPVNLNMQGRNGFKTLFGVILTAAYLAGVIVIAVTIGSTYFDTTSPTVVTQVTEESVYPKQNLAENHILPAVFIANSLGQLYSAVDVLRFVTPSFYRLTLNTTVDGAGVGTTKYTVKTIPMLPCSKVLSDPKAGKLYDIYTATNPLFRLNATASAYCANTTEEELYVEGGGNDLLQTYLIFELYPCTLADQAKCATTQEFNAMRFTNPNPAVAMNLSQFDKPTETNIQLAALRTLSEQLFLKSNLRLARTIIKDVTGLGGETQTRKYFSRASESTVSIGSRPATQMACTVSQVVSKACVPYLSYTWVSSGIKTEITRTYKTVLRTLSEIGGLINLIFLVANYSSYLFAFFTIKNTFVKMIFPFIYSKEFQLKVSQESKDEKGVYSSSKFKANMKKIKDQAYNSIEKSLDVLNIVRELNNLKILTHMIMSEHHRSIAPLVALNIHEEGSKQSSPTVVTAVKPSSPTVPFLSMINKSKTPNKVQASSILQQQFAAVTRTDEPQILSESVKHLETEAKHVSTKQQQSEKQHIYTPCLQELTSVFCVKSLQRSDSLLGFVLKHSADKLSDPGIPSSAKSVLKSKPSSGEEAPSVEVQIFEETERKMLPTGRNTLNSSILSYGHGRQDRTLAPSYVLEARNSFVVVQDLESSPRAARVEEFDEENISEDHQNKLSHTGAANGMTASSKPLKKVKFVKTEKNQESASGIMLSQQH